MQDPGHGHLPHPQRRGHPRDPLHRRPRLPPPRHVLLPRWRRVRHVPAQRIPEPGAVLPRHVPASRRIIPPRSPLPAHPTTDTPTCTQHIRTHALLGHKQSAWCALGRTGVFYAYCSFSLLTRIGLKQN